MSRFDLKRDQLDWARRRRVQVDSKGYVERLERNLFIQLCDDSQRDFARGSGGEARKRGASRPKLHALHSSAALVCNAFEYWRANGPALLVASLGLPAGILEFRYEAQFPTGLPGDPPNLDVALELRDGSTCALESKFTEPYASAKDQRKAMKAKYFPDGTSVWSQRGLTNCGSLAEAVRTGDLRFLRLDAAQLLKHILGLQNCRRHFALKYLWLDADSRIGHDHRTELAIFAKHIGSEVPFTAITYQELWARLRSLAGPFHNPYFEYMLGRYVGENAR